MSKVNDGGSAFPSHGTMGEVVQEGMTLRDWFAGQALMGYLANPAPGAVIESQMVKICYIMADAMIAEGEKGK